MRIQLFAFKPGSDSQYQLPAPIEYNATMTHSDVGALTLTYPLDATGLSVLNGYADVEIRRLDGATWKCLPQGRFCLSQITPDVIDETGMPVRRFQFQSFAWQLRGILQERTTGLNDQGQRRFLGKTISQAVGILIDEAHAKGSAPDLTWEIVSDSGAACRPVNLGQDVESILSAAHDQGFLDWQVIPDDTGQGRKLALYSTLGSDKSDGDNPVDLRQGRDVVAAPATMSALDVRPRALVQGELGESLLLSNSAADAPYGNLAQSVSASGASTVGQLQITGQAALDKARTWRTEETCQIRFESARWLPFADYGLGDKVMAPGPLAGMQSQKIQQIVLTLSASDGLGGSVVLGERFVTGPEWVQKRIKQTSGSGWNYNWNPAPPTTTTYTPGFYPSTAPSYPTVGDVVLSSQPVIPTLGAPDGLPRPCTTSVAALSGDAYALDTRGPNALYRYRPADQEWATLASLSDVARGQLLVSDGANLFACGGTAAAGAIRYDVSAGTWGSSPVGGATQPPLTSWGYGGGIGGKVYFGGGESSTGGGAGGQYVLLSPFGSLIAGDSSGGVWTSPDGSSWEWHAEVLPSGVQPNIIAHSPELGVFLAVYGTAIYSSPDALTWTLAHTAPATVRSAMWAAGPGVFVLGMDSISGVLTSPDGATWTTRALSTPGGATAYQVQAVAASSSRIVVACGSSGGQFSAWSDDAGATWAHSATLAASTTGEPICGTWADGLSLFVIGDTAGDVHTSADGSSWTKVTSPSGVSIGDVAWAGSLSLLVAFVGGSWVYTSADGGATWTQVLAETSIAGISWSPALAALLAFTSGQTFYLSTDGSTWTSTTGSGGSPYDGVWAAGPTTIGPGVVIAVGALGDVVASAHGTTWSDVSGGAIPGDGLDSPAYDPVGGVIVVADYSGSGSLVWRSTNGSAWTSVDTGMPAAPHKVAWSPTLSLFVAVDGSGNTATSADGLTWSSPVATGAGTFSTGALAWVPLIGKFILAPAGGTIYLSADGTTWTSATCPVTGPYAVGSNGSVIVAVGSAGAAAYSTNGTSWTSVTLTGNLWSVDWSESLGLFVASGGSGGYSSPDGMTWTELAAGPYGIVAATGDGFVMLGSAEGFTSADGVAWAGYSGGPSIPNGAVWIPDLTIDLSGVAFSGAFHAYDGDTDAWSALADGPAVSHSGSCVIDGKVYVLGGRTASGYSAELHRYDPAVNSWEQLASAPWAISDPAVCTANGKLFVLGGEEQLVDEYLPIPHAGIYDPAADTWATSQDLTVPHTAAGACEIDDYLYVPGGVADGYHDHEADILTGTDASLFSDVLTVWMSPPSPISVFNGSGSGGGWGPLIV